MDQPSELASIMRSLNQEALLRKQNLENGVLSEANSKLIFKMITAEPTEPHMVGPAFAPYGLRTKLRSIEFCERCRCPKFQYTV